jgi:hypothetical protein
MTKMKNDLLERLFGIKPKITIKHTPTITSLHPSNRPSFNAWCRELKVSSRFGR